MQFSDAAKSEILTTVYIELERMFTVLSNYYNQYEYPEHSLILPEIEEQLRQCVIQIE